jgi:DNA invertase Pin-like site-specific DNA recombinase
MPAYVAYYRVRARHGASGLGLDAQRAAVARHLGGQGQLVAEYTEIESGRRHTNRPQLLAALEECRKRRAVLLIARLDRLARNVAFIANLMESGADFVAVDMPQATRLTIHILAAALVEAKRRGTKLGNPRIEQARPLAIAAHHASRPRRKLMNEWRGQGKTLRHGFKPTQYPPCPWPSVVCKQCK